MNATSYGLRLGAKIFENFSIELAHHLHGKFNSRVEVSTPMPAPGSPDPGGSGVLPPEYDRHYTHLFPIDLQSTKFGFKGELAVIEYLSVNARVGIAHWSYDKASPQDFTMIGGTYGAGDNGNSVYYSIGVDYQLYQNFQVGLEYSLLSIEVEEMIDGSVLSAYQHDVTDISLSIGWMF